MILAWRATLYLAANLALLSHGFYYLVVLASLAAAAMLVPFIAHFIKGSGMLGDTASRVTFEATHRKSAEDAIAAMLTAQTALKDSERRLHGIIDSAMDAIITVDEDQKIAIMNRAAEAVFLVKAADMIGAPLDALIPEHADFWHLNFQSGAAARAIETTGMRSTSEEFPVEATISEVQTHSGKLFTIILRDITLRKESDRQLQQLAKMEAMGRLAGGVAHDFNNVLMVVRGNMELMLMDLDDKERLRRSASVTMAAVDRTATMVKQLLLFSRQKEAEPRSVDLNSVLRDMEQMMGRLLGANVSLAIDYTAHIENVDVDPGQVFRAIMNLVLNSKDAMPDGGKITVAARMTTLDENYARLRPDVAPGRYVVISVQDGGTGIDPEVKKRMFEPFFTTKEEGTGLGLSVVVNAVRQYGGHVSVYSETGKGTVIKLYFPVTDNHQTTVHRMVFPLAGTLIGTVLVVEDEAALRSIICEALLARGITVLEASNGNEALQLARKHIKDIRIVVSDMVMPILGGLEMATELRKLVPHFSLILMSGYNDNPDTAEDVRKIGAQMLQKPFPLQDLMQKIWEAARSSN